jgi:hypothetical protein
VLAARTGIAEKIDSILRTKIAIMQIAVGFASFLMFKEWSAFLIFCVFIFLSLPEILDPT